MTSREIWHLLMLELHIRAPFMIVGFTWKKDRCAGCGSPTRRWAGFYCWHNCGCTSDDDIGRAIAEHLLSTTNKDFRMW